MVCVAHSYRIDVFIINISIAVQSFSKEQFFFLMQPQLLFLSLRSLKHLYKYTSAILSMVKTRMLSILSITEYLVI